MKHKSQRVAVFVDIQNLYYSSRVLFNKKVDYAGILNGAVAGRQLIRAIGYGIATEDAHEDKFFDAMEDTGYEIKTKDLQIFSGGQKKGDWDVGIAVDAIKISQKVDVIVLVSGDGDYIPLVKYLQSTSGCRVEGMSFGESTSIRLIETLDDFINLSENKEKYTIFQKRSKKQNNSKNNNVITVKAEKVIAKKEAKDVKKTEKKSETTPKEEKVEKFISLAKLSEKKSTNKKKKLTKSVNSKQKKEKNTEIKKEDDAIKKVTKKTKTTKKDKVIKKTTKKTKTTKETKSK